jgi:hypothetical protein
LAYGSSGTLTHSSIAQGIAQALFEEAVYGDGKLVALREASGTLLPSGLRTGGPSARKPSSTS